MSEKDTVLQFRDVGLRQGTTRILEGINWSVRRGEHWAVLGRNGAGKTALLNVLLAHLPATTGSIELLGSRYGKADWRDIRTQIGVVSDSFGQRIANTETVAGIVRSGIDGTVGLRRSPDRKERASVLSAIERMDLAARVDHPWRNLSQGERQRTLIARALAGEPALLILDEPCTGLDPIARAELLARLDALTSSSSSPTVIYVTHHIEEIDEWMTHVLGLAAGRLVSARTRADTLNAQVLETIYGVPVELDSDESGRHRLSVNLVSAGTN